MADRRMLINALKVSAQILMLAVLITVVHAALGVKADGIYTFSGNLTDSNNNPLVGVNVQFSTGGAGGSSTTDSTGHFSLSGVPGTYSLVLSNNLPGGGLLKQGSNSIDLTTGNVTQNLQLNTTSINVTVKDSNGNVVPNAPVYDYSGSGGTGGSTTLYPGDPGESLAAGFYNSGTTDGSGNASLGSIVGLKYSTAPNNGICATISGTTVCDPNPVTVSGVTNVVIQEPPIYTFSGNLTDSNNTPLVGVNVQFSSGGQGGSSTTDSNGHFSLTGVSGTYNLVISNNLPGGGQLKQSSNAINLTNNITQNLQLNTTTINVTVKDSNGNVVPSAPVYDLGGGPTTLYPGDPGETSISTFYTSGTTDVNGNASLATVVGFNYGTAPNNGICATISGTTICDPNPVTVNGLTNVVIQQPPIYTFSGNLTDSNNNPLVGVNVEFSTGGAGGTSTTDSNGHFSLSGVPGTYSLVIVNNLPGGGQLKQSSGAVDLTSGNITQNLQLNTTSINVTVKDSNGNVVPNAQVYDYSSFGLRGGTMTLYPGDPGETLSAPFYNSGTTDGNGNASLPSIVGLKYGTAPNGGICATISGTTVCDPNPVTVSGVTNVVIQPINSAPTNLSIPSPTTAPALSWTASSGATSYNIYRNGTNVGSSTTTSFTDSSAPEGTDSYYVTAVNSGGESAPSNSVNVIVTSGTAPAITSGASTSTGMRTPFDFQVATTGTPTPAITESGTLPSGITFTDNGNGTADISGMAAVGSNGTYPITITASNGTTPNAAQNFTLTITTATSAPTSLTSSNNSTTLPSNYGSAMTPITITATGYTVPKITMSGPPLPSGVNFHDNGNGTATISGTPSGNAGGVYTITITATNSSGTISQTYTIVVNKISNFTSIPNNELTATVGSEYSLTATATGYPVAAITESGNLPSGLSFTDNGNGTATIAGTPAAGTGGTYSITVTATNSSGATNDTFTISVNQAPAITSANSDTITFGVAMTPFTVTTTGYPAPNLSASTLPSGVNFHDNHNGTATISGTPSGSARGTHTITITATNSTGTVNQSFTLTVQ